VARTYNVPATVVASIKDALSFVDVERTHEPDLQLATKFVTSGKAVLEDIVHVHSSPIDPLRGGDAGRAWSQKIMDGVARDLERNQTATLDKYGYDPDRYAYAGITAPNNEDLITTIVRMPRGDDHLDRSEALTATGWHPVEFDFHGEDRDTFGVGMDADLLAFTASALIDDGVNGVLLSYDEPICFLPDHPLLASAPAKQVNGEGSVYAIVDSTDTSAVMDVIMITPGEKHALVYRRNGGAWKLEPTLYEAFMSVTPPPIVELTGSQRAELIAQVDATIAGQIQTTGNGQAQLGPNPVQLGGGKAAPKPGAEADPKKGKTAADPVQKLKPKAPPGAAAPPEGREKRTPQDAEEGPNSRPPLAASGLADIARTRHERRIEAMAWYYSDEGYASGFSLTAALQAIDADTKRDELDWRQQFVQTTTAELAKTRATLRAQKQVILPALTAASTNKAGVHDKPGQRTAEQLRQYWVHGAGSVKINWAAPGAFTRCVRQLRKHLGTRAEGYCALRFKETHAYWPGDARND
jgi:hypothetical protein